MNLRHRALLTVLGVLLLARATFAEWYAGAWDASGIPYRNGHPTTLALRIEVLDAQSGLPIEGASISVEGHWVDAMGLEKPFVLTADTEESGIAVVSLLWSDKNVWNSFGPAKTVDDISKAQKITIKKSNYKYKECALDFSALTRSPQGWKELMTTTPDAKLFDLDISESFTLTNSTSNDPLFFNKIRSEEYHKVYTKEYFADRILDVPTSRDRQTTGVYMLIPYRILLDPTTQSIRVNP